MATTFSQHRGRIALVGLILVHLAIISRQVDGGGGQSLLTSLVLDRRLPHPDVRRGRQARASRSLWTGYVDLRGSRVDRSGC